MRTLTTPLRHFGAVLLLLGLMAVLLPVTTAGAQEEPAELVENAVAEDEPAADPATDTATATDTAPVEAPDLTSLFGDPGADSLPAERAATMMAPLAAAAPGGYFRGGYWEDQAVSANPPMPQRCGLNIALVFDVSNSIGVNGLRQSQIAGNAFVEGLKNTPTTLGVYNFATVAPIEGTSDQPSIDLGSDAGVRQARAAINGLQLPVEDYGGTNWEGALKNVADSGVKYDVVYFITDGIPTANNELFPGGDLGSIAHNYDITRAVDAANSLKNGGTRLEVIAVKMPTRGVSVVQDNAREVEDSYGELARFADAHIERWDNHGPYYTYTGNPRYSYVPSTQWSLYDDAVRYGALTYDENAGGDGRYYYLAGADSTAIPRNTWGDYVGTEKVRFRIDEFRLNKPSALSIATALTGTPDDVLFLRSYDLLAAELRKAAVEICGGTVIVEKQIVDADGTVLHQGTDWEFTADRVRSDDAAHPIHLVDDAEVPTASLERRTDVDGLTQFAVKTDSPHKSGSVRLTETQQEEYSLHPQNGKNATCVDRDNRPVEVTNDGDLGFRVGIATDQTIMCTVQNVRHVYDVAVKKAPHPGHTPVIAFDGTFTAKYDITVSNRARTPVTLRSPVVDTVTFPPGFTVEKMRFLLDGKELAADGSTIPAAALGEFAGGESKVITVEVDGQASPEAVGTVVDGTYERCENPATATPRSLHNAVHLDGDEDPSDNYACVDPEQPGMSVDKQVTGDTGQLAADGTRYVTYTVTAKNPADGIKRTYTLTDTPAFSETVTIDHALINGERIDGAGPYQLTDGAVEIAPGETHTYTVEVHFRGPVGSRETWECHADGAGHGLFNSVKLESGAVTEEDDACGPVPAPEKVTLLLEKVDADDTTSPLGGAAFAVHEVSADGSVGAKITDLVAGDGGFHSGSLEADREYYLVETRSPAEYQLLPVPVKVSATVTPTGATLQILNPADALSATVRESDGRTVVLQVADIRIGSLPKTGGMGVGVIGALGALIIGIGAGALRRRG